MKVDIGYKDALYSIEQEIARIPKQLEGDRKTILNKSAKIIKANVIKNLPKSDLNASATNYDGTPYVHMRNGVKTSVKDDNEGFIYAVISGDKYTGYKWHMLENGTSDTKAIHFIEKALKESNEEIDKVIDDEIRKLVQGGS